MRITLYTDYSLRVLLYLAVKGEELATIREIAEAYDISRNHLMKVVHDLQQRGYVETLRGKNGGIRLGRSAPEINVGEVVRATEQELNLVECMGEKDNCVITRYCDLRTVLDEALDAFFAVLDRYTLQDLLAPDRRRGLAQVLNLSGVPVKVV